METLSFILQNHFVTPSGKGYPFYEKRVKYGFKMAYNEIEQAVKRGLLYI